MVLELPLKTLKAVCVLAIMEMRNKNQNIPPLPIAAAIVTRLAALQGAATPSKDAAGDALAASLSSPFSFANGNAANNSISSGSNNNNGAVVAGNNNSFTGVHNPWDSTGPTPTASVSISHSPICIIVI